MTSPTGPAPADPRDITYGELLPFLSYQDLRRRGFLWPGFATAAVGAGMFLALELHNSSLFFYLLTTFIGLANLYLIYLWCGKKMPFPYVLSIAVFALVLDFLLIKPIVLGNRTLPFPIAPALVEEPAKALPLLFVWFLTRFLPHARQRKYGLREPLDGIVLAAASATGFSFLETMLDYMPKYGAIVGPPRFLFEVFGHIAYSAVLGYYFGLAALHHHKPLRVAAALALGLFTAGALHDLWDANLFPGNVFGVLVLQPLQEIVIGLASLVILASMILKGREISPEREFLWPYGAMQPYLAPEVGPLPEMPPMPGDRWLAIGKSRIRLDAGADLTNRDLPGLTPAGPDGIVAQVMTHPTDPALLVLRNLSRSKWEAVAVDGTVRAITPGETLRLVPGTRVVFGTIAGAVLLTPHYAAGDLPAVTKPGAANESG